MGAVKAMNKPFDTAAVDTDAFSMMCAEAFGAQVERHEEQLRKGLDRFENDAVRLQWLEQEIRSTDGHHGDTFSRGMIEVEIRKRAAKNVLQTLAQFGFKK